MPTNDEMSDDEFEAYFRWLTDPGEALKEAFEGAVQTMRNWSAAGGSWRKILFYAGMGIAGLGLAVAGAFLAGRGNMQVEVR